jgi:hypothetical protein
MDKENCERKHHTQADSGILLPIQEAGGNFLQESQPTTTTQPHRRIIALDTSRVNENIAPTYLYQFCQSDWVWEAKLLLNRDS